MEPTKPILGYWTTRGLAAPIIYLLKHVGVDYEHKEYDLKIKADGSVDGSDWFGVKPSMTMLDFPNLPYFIDGDVTLSENLAICEYICAKWCPDLLGKDLEARGLVNMLAGVFADFRREFTGECYAFKPESSRTSAIEVLNKKLPSFYNYLGSSSFLTGSSVTWIDFAFYELVLVMHFVHPSLFTEFPLLKNYAFRVAELPGLKEYLAKKDNCQKTR
jgi:glutathione S-transferase